MLPKTILVVEDEQPIREVLRRILSREGFQVLEASHGQEALNVFKRRSKEIQLVLMDISMPQMDGQTCGRLMLKERPELRIIYMSGDMDPAHMPEDLIKPTMTFLAKPFTLDILLSTVRRFLDAQD